VNRFAAQDCFLDTITRLRLNQALKRYCFIMAEKEVVQNKPEGAPDHIDKLAFTAVAAPGSSGDSGKNPHEIPDLDQFIPKGPPATTKEVWSYYLFYAADNGIGTFQ
jgi:hypothetical protein